MKSKLVRLLMLGGLSAGTTLYGSSCGSQLWRFNPCGTILSTNICSPTDWYARVFDGPRYHVDPACVIPFQCGGESGIPGGASPGGNGTTSGGTGGGGGGTGGGGTGGTGG